MNRYYDRRGYHSYNSVNIISFVEKTDIRQYHKHQTLNNYINVSKNIHYLYYTFLYLNYLMTLQKYSFRLTLLGKTTVGKTSIVDRFRSDSFSPSLEATIGPAFHSENFRIENSQIKLEIWDTAGQERFQSLGVMYYFKATCSLVVFDVTDPSSFDTAKAWVKEIKENVPHEACIVLVANKIDLERDVEKEEVVKYL